jgi:hypothetical protein
MLNGISQQKDQNSGNWGIYVYCLVYKDDAQACNLLANKNNRNNDLNIFSFFCNIEWKFCAFCKILGQRAADNTMELYIAVVGHTEIIYRCS